MATRTVLATVSRMPAGGLDTPERRDRLRADTGFWVRRASRMGAAMVAFPEVCPQMGTPGDAMYRHIEPADGGTLEWIAELARAHSIDIVWPRFERRGDGCYNTSLYVDRRGELLGRYDKMFPTIGEMEHGITPGTQPVCVETEFGRVGFAICYDLNFVELRDAYRPLRPDVIVFSSMYRGGVKVQFWAVDLGCYLACAYPTELGRIVDRGGKIVALSTYEALALAEVNLNSVQLHMDYNWDKMDAMLERYNDTLRFDYHTQEGRYVIASTGPPIDEVCREFDLWHPTCYFAAARAMRRRVLGESLEGDGGRWPEG